MPIRDGSPTEEPFPSTAIDLMESTLASCGEQGYLNTAVGQIIARAGSSRASFYRCFGSKAECFEHAEEWKADRLMGQLLSATDDGKCDLYRSLLALASFLIQEPLQARATLIEARAVAGAPRVRHRQRLRRLGQALDDALRPAAESQPPACAGELAVGAIASMATVALTRGQPRDFLSAVPELVGFVEKIYS